MKILTLLLTGLLTTSTFASTEPFLTKALNCFNKEYGYLINIKPTDPFSGKAYFSFEYQCQQNDPKRCTETGNLASSSQQKDGFDLMIDTIIPYSIGNLYLKDHNPRIAFFTETHINRPVDTIDILCKEATPSSEDLNRSQCETKCESLFNQPQKYRICFALCLGW